MVTRCQVPVAGEYSLQFGSKPEFLAWQTGNRELVTATPMISDSLPYKSITKNSDTLKPENRIFAQLFENEDSNSTGYNY
jgi:hypothetical protein